MAASAIDGGASAPKQQTELFLHWNISPKLRNRCVGGGAVPPRVRLTTARVQLTTAPLTHAAAPRRTTPPSCRYHSVCERERREGGRERHVITQIWCLRADKIWYAIQTPYLTQLAKHSHLYWLDCLLLGVSLSWSVNLFPSVTCDWPRHTHTQTWQSSEYQRLSLASFSK